VAIWRRSPVELMDQIPYPVLAALRSPALCSGPSAYNAAIECNAFLCRAPATRPVNTRRAPAAIRKYANANAILAITMEEREHRVFCAKLPPTTL
jgi:hypothetical protein